jgi:lipid-binding SYLF domain-containing protein
MHFDQGHFAATVALALLTCGVTAGAQSRDQKIADELVTRATATIGSLGHNKHYPALDEAIVRSQAVLIFPHLFSAGFVFAGARGSGVLLVRDTAAGHWVGPAFYSLTQASVGLQAGASTSEYIIVVHSQRALKRRRSNCCPDADRSMKASALSPIQLCMIRDRLPLRRTETPVIARKFGDCSRVLRSTNQEGTS